MRKILQIYDWKKVKFVVIDLLYYFGSNGFTADVCEAPGRNVLGAVVGVVMGAVFGSGC